MVRNRSTKTSVVGELSSHTTLHLTSFWTVGVLFRLNQCWINEDRSVHHHPVQPLVKVGLLSEFCGFVLLHNN